MTGQSEFTHLERERRADKDLGVEDLLGRPRVGRETLVEFVKETAGCVLTFSLAPRYQGKEADVAGIYVIQQSMPSAICLNLRFFERYVH